MTAAGKPFAGERVFSTQADKRDWVSLGPLSMHIIARGGKYVLRLADNESPLRTHFPGCVWYPPDAAYKLEAKFVPYLAGRTLSIVNIIGETSQQPCPGYAEFQLHGQTHRLDAIAENGGLFFVFRDATAGDTTYGASRFLDIEKQPQDNESFTFDFNKAYNPPCAVSEFTTCPLPPKQNILKTRIEAGEKYQGRHRERPVRVSGASKWTEGIAHLSGATSPLRAAHLISSPHSAPRTPPSSRRQIPGEFPTTCPLPPQQKILKTSIEAGEKYNRQ